MRVVLFTVLFFTLLCQTVLAWAPGAPAHYHQMLSDKQAAAEAEAFAKAQAALSSSVPSAAALEERAGRRQILKLQAIKRERTRRAANRTIGTNKRFALKKRSASIADAMRSSL